MAPPTIAPTTQERRKIKRNVDLVVIAIPPFSVGIHALGDACLQDFWSALVVVGLRLNEDLRAAPHNVLDVVSAELVAAVYGDFFPTDAIEVIAGIDANHRLGKFRHTLRGIGPRPRCRQHADRAQRPDLVIEHLVDMPVNVGDLSIRLQDLVNVAPIAHPEIPRRVVLVKWIMGGNDDRLVLVPVGKRLLQPVELVAANAGPRARDGTVEGCHVAHTLFRGHVLRRPVVRSPANRVAADEAHALVVESPSGLAEQLAPLLAHVEIPVVLARDEVFRNLDVLENLITELEFLDRAKLGKVAAEEQKVRWRIHSLNILDRTHRLFDETRVERLRIEMGVRNPGELERRVLGVSDIDGVYERPPRECLADSGGAK